MKEEIWEAVVVGEVVWWINMGGEWFNWKCISRCWVVSAVIKERLVVVGLEARFLDVRVIVLLVGG